MLFIKRLRFSYDYILILLCLASTNIYYFAPSFEFFPAHDSMSWLVHFFYFFYNEYFINGQLPLWIPYSTFGHIVDYCLITTISPAQYFVMFTGKMLGVQDAMALLKVSMAIEQLAFVTFMYLLSKKLFKQRLSILFVCIGAVFTIFWGINYGINFRSYYLMPLVLLFIIHFLDTSQIKYLWLAGIASVISMVGNTPYYLPIYAIIYLTFSLVLFFSKRDHFKLTIKDTFSFSSLASLVFFIALSFIYIDFVNHMLDFTSGFNTGRSESGSVPLRTFLFHGGLYENNSPVSGSGLDVLWQFIYACPRTYDFVVYVGLIPIVFLFYAMFFVNKNRYIKAMTIPCALIILLNLGDISFVSTTLYLFFPLMDYYRHITYLPVFTKIFILLIAGFGLEHYIQSNGVNRKVKSPVFIGTVLAVSILLVDIFIFKGEFGYTRTFRDIISYRFHFLPLIILAIMVIYMSQSTSRLKGKKAYLIVLLFFIEIASFYTALFVGMPVNRHPSLVSDAFKVEKYDFQDTRNDIEYLYKDRPSIKRAIQYEAIIDYPLKYNAFYLDPGIYDIFNEKMRVFNISDGVKEFMHQRLGYEEFLKLTSEYKTDSLDNDYSFLRATGYKTSKINIVLDPIVVSDPTVARNIVSDYDEIDSHPVIYDPSLVADCELKISDLPNVEASDNVQKGDSWYYFYLYQNNNNNIRPFWEVMEELPYWLLIKFADKEIVTEYKLSAGVDSGTTGRMPRTWILQGSNDMHDWSDLDERTDKKDWSTGESRSYKITSPTPSRFYRLYITSICQGGNLMRLRTFSMKLVNKTELDGSVVQNTTNFESSHGKLLPTTVKDRFNNKFGTVKSLSFSANKLKLIVDDVKSSDSWLTYLDGYHPGWKATVNKQPRKVAQANLAFKAVKLDSGHNKIEFLFTGNHHTKLYTKIFFCLGLIGGLYIITISIQCLLDRPGVSINFKYLPVLLGFFVCLPIFVMEFGLHNDYAFAKFAIPDKLNFTNILFAFKDESPHLVLIGRPVNAFLMGIITIFLTNIKMFAFIRFVSFVFTLFCACLVYNYLKKRLNVNHICALTLSFTLFALPSSQSYIVFITTFVGGPLTILITIFSYLIYDKAVNSAFKPSLLIFAFFLLFVAFLIYPPNVLFFLTITSAKILFSKFNSWPKTRLRVSIDILFCITTIFFSLILVKFVITTGMLKLYPGIEQFFIEPERYTLTFTLDLHSKILKFYEILLIAFGLWFHTQFHENIAYAVMLALLIGGGILIWINLFHKNKGSFIVHKKRSQKIKWLLQMCSFFFLIILISNGPVLVTKTAYLSYRVLFPCCAIICMLIVWIPFEICSYAFKKEWYTSRVNATMTLSICFLLLSALLAGSNMYSSALSASKELTFLREKLLDSEDVKGAGSIVILKPPWGSSFVESTIKHEFNYMATNYFNTPLPEVILKTEMTLPGNICISYLGENKLMNELYKNPERSFIMDDSFRNLKLYKNDFMIDMNEITNSQVMGKYRPIPNFK